MVKRSALITVGLGGLILLAVVAATAAPPTTTAPKTLGFSELSNGRGGTNVEAFVVPGKWEPTV